MSKSKVKTYNVHIYAVVRIKVPGITAKSPALAACAAEESINIFNEIGTTSQTGKEIEYAENLTGFVVDEIDKKGHVVNEGGSGLDLTSSYRRRSK